MKRTSILKKIGLLQCIFISAQSFAQDINITGTVVNSNQDPVANVKVSLSNSPGITCYSDKNGDFTLTLVPSNIPHTDEDNGAILYLPDGSLEICGLNQSFNMSVFDLTGRPVGKVVNKEKLGGTYIIFPCAYIQDLPMGIYIARVIVGNQIKSHKINNFNRSLYSRDLTPKAFSENESLNKGLIQSKSLKNNIIATVKSDSAFEDTLIFEHDFYKTKTLKISDYQLNIGSVELENFGDYSPALGIEPDKMVYNKENGNFIMVYGQDSSLFVIDVLPQALDENELTIKAIPVKKFEFLDAKQFIRSGPDSSFKFISGIHLEPSGTQFYLPVQVNVIINEDNRTDSLVVILHDDESGKLYYIPFVTDKGFFDPVATSIGFSISHFSDIIIGKGSVPAGSNLSFANSDEAISAFTPQYQPDYLSGGTSEVNVPDEFFSQWYNEVIKYEIASIIDMETLRFAIRDLLYLAQAAIYAGKFIEKLSFYNEAILSLNEKFNYLFDKLKLECSTISDICQKRNIALQAVQLNIVAQYFQGINQMDLSELCNGDIPKIPNKIVIAQQQFVIKPGETDQIDCSVENIDNLQITADLEWRSDDPGIVTVDNTGKITGVSEGLALVHVKCCNIENMVLVTVNSQTTDPCLTLSRPLVGTYKSRIFLHGYNEDINTHASSDLKLSIIMTMNFAEDGYPNTYYYEGTASQRNVYTEFDPVIARDYVVSRVECSQDAFHSDRVRELWCSEYGYYHTDDLPWFGFGEVIIYPNSKTVKMRAWYIDDRIYGVGNF